MWETFLLEKQYRKCDGETSPRPFSEKLKLSISLDQESNIVCQAEGYRNMLKLPCRLLAFTSH